MIVRVVVEHKCKEGIEYQSKRDYLLSHLPTPSIAGELIEVKLATYAMQKCLLLNAKQAPNSCEDQWCVDFEFILVW